MINKKYFIPLIVVIMLVCVIGTASAYTGTGFSHQIPESKYSSLSSNDILSKYNQTTCSEEVHGKCIKVIDGDTITVDGVGKVRLVGVNTPEKGVDGAETSTEFVKKLCLNKDVSLDIDDSKHYDKYGRTLAVVIVDGKNLNEMLLKENLAEIMYIPPSEFNPYSWSPTGSLTSDIYSLQNSTVSSDSPTHSSVRSYIGNSNSHKFHESTCSAAKKISEGNKVSFSTRDEAVNQGYVPCKICNP